MDVKSNRQFLRAGNWRGWRSSPRERDESRGIPMPPVQKPYPSDACLVDLVPPDAFTIGQMPLIEAVRQRRSHRRFTPEPLTLEEVSFLLWATQGVREVHARDGGTITFRTVPSGGARHPFETYLLVNRVTGLKPALYRYLPLEHRLVLVREGDDLASEVSRACLGQRFVGEGAVVFIWTAIPYRTEWRYAHVAAKIVAIDAGHVCQSLYLACPAIGAGTCAIGAYSQEDMDAFVGVDGEEEFVIYAAPVGKVA